MMKKVATSWLRVFLLKFKLIRNSLRILVLDKISLKYFDFLMRKRKLRNWTFSFKVKISQN